MMGSPFEGPLTFVDLKRGDWAWCPRKCMQSKYSHSASPVCLRCFRLDLQVRYGSKAIFVDAIWLQNVSLRHVVKMSYAVMNVEFVVQCRRRAFQKGRLSVAGGKDLVNTHCSVSLCFLCLRLRGLVAVCNIRPG